MSDRVVSRLSIALGEPPVAIHVVSLSAGRLSLSRPHCYMFTRGLLSSVCFPRLLTPFREILARPCTAHQQLRSLLSRSHSFNKEVTRYLHACFLLTLCVKRGESWCSAGLSNCCGCGNISLPCQWCRPAASTVQHHPPLPPIIRPAGQPATAGSGTHQLLPTPGCNSHRVFLVNTPIRKS